MKLNFNAETVEARENDFDLIPPGVYVAEITESEQKDTKAGNGSYLQLTFRIIEGDKTGRYLWERLNLDNPNATAVQIANEKLGDICRAAGRLKISDSEELHGVPMRVRVRIRKGDNGYADSNEIVAYSAVEGQVNATPTATTAGKSRPW